MVEDIVWRNAHTPESARFGDVYFSAEDGLAESRHVFLDGIGAPGAWAGHAGVCLGETGFGTGLNFLLSWRAARAAGVRLDYVSVEGFPLSRDQLAHALAAFPELAAEAAALAEAWPVPHPGHHLLSFDDGRIALHLLVGPVEARLARLDARVDGWFLDGFAPSRNPEMWTPGVFAQVARLSAPGARLATFTAAGHVRRGLEAVGFTVAKRAGFGRKRECIAATFTGEPAPPETPWFRRPAPVPEGPVAVIGGGIGGAAMAHALRRAGRPVVLLEAGPALAREGSGNPSALMKPRLTPGHEEPYGRFHALAFLHALRLYDTLPDAIWHPGRGVLVAARDAAEQAAQESLTTALPWPETHLRRVGPQEAEALSGFAAPLGGLWYGRAGCLRPHVLCPALAEGAEVRLNTPVGGLETTDGGGWRLRAPDGAPLLEAAAVVLCAGAALPEVWPEAQWPLGRSRGQITLLSAAESGGPRAALSFGGYLTAPFTDADGRRLHALGATYDRWRHRADDWRVLRAEDDVRNLSLLRDHLPEVAARLSESPVGGRAGLRCTIADHLPLAGPVHDRPAFLAAYDRLHHGVKAGPFPPAPLHEGLFVLGALGSRGFHTAPLAAALVAALVTGGPLPVDSQVAAALHPARHDLRRLRKHPTKKTKGNATIP